MQIRGAVFSFQTLSINAENVGGFPRSAVIVAAAVNDVDSRMAADSVPRSRKCDA
jgi:hypothetical protein